MNILHISRTMGQGGAEKIVYQLCKDDCADLNIVASCGGEYVDLLSKIGVKNIDIEDFQNKNPFNIFKTLLKLNKIISEYKINIIHSHHRMAAFYARLLQIMNKDVIHIYTAHNVFYGKKNLLRFALKNSQIVACGSTVKDNLTDYYKIDENKIKIIYNAVEKPSNYEKKVVPEIDQNNINIGLIGRISEQKGVDLFIKSIQKITKKFPKVKCFIIGDGEDRASMEDLVNRLNLEEHIKFLGFRRDVFNLIDQIDFIVMPSRWEGFPLTPIEVFSMHKTIIVSDIKNNLEIVTNNYNGLTFETEKISELTKKIEEMILINRKKLEDNAFETYNKRFSYNQFINNYNVIYKELL